MSQKNTTRPASSWFLQPCNPATLQPCNHSDDRGTRCLGLRNRDGLKVLAELPHQGNSLPVVILTARETVADRIKGLNASADDFVCKPFDFDELVARLRAVMRRRAGLACAVLEYRDVSLNPTTRRVAYKGRLLGLSAKEFALLELLLQRPGVVLTRHQLRDKLYGWDDEVGSNTVEVFIHSLRRKLGHDYIENCSGLL
jgi:two-component system response regulator QseB